MIKLWLKIAALMHEINRPSMTISMWRSSQRGLRVEVSASKPLERARPSSRPSWPSPAQATNLISTRTTIRMPTLMPLWLQLRPLMRNVAVLIDSNNLLRKLNSLGKASARPRLMLAQWLSNSIVIQRLEAPPVSREWSSMTCFSISEIIINNKPDNLTKQTK